MHRMCKRLGRDPTFIWVMLSAGMRVYALTMCSLQCALCTRMPSSVLALSSGRDCDKLWRAHSQLCTTDHDLFVIQHTTTESPAVYLPCAHKSFAHVKDLALAYFAACATPILYDRDLFFFFLSFFLPFFLLLLFVWLQHALNVFTADLLSTHSLLKQLNGANNPGPSVIEKWCTCMHIISAGENVKSWIIVMGFFRFIY